MGGTHERGEDTVISAEETVIAEDQTVISVDDTIITVAEPVASPELRRRITDSVLDGPQVPYVLEVPRSADVFFLRTVTGERYSLSTAVVLGRAPRVARIPGGDVVQLVSLPSREGRVSTTHVELRQVGGVVVVTDLRSTNGTRVTLASGVSRQLAPGDSMAIGEGAVVDIGDGNRIDVMRETTRDASNDIAR